MTWRVLLAEDEEIVRNYVKKLVPWSKYGFTLAGEAENGEEALEKIKKLKPELVIADIIMPVMDGITLLKRTNELGCSCSFIMLTCMTEFEYAQQALEYGAISYIPKLSMSMESIGSALKKAAIHLENRTQYESAVSQQESAALYEHLWKQLVETEAPADVSAKPLINRNMKYSHVLLYAALPGSAGLREESPGNRDLLVHDTPVLLHRHSGEGLDTWICWCGQDARIREVEDPNPYSAAALITPVPIDCLAQAWLAMMHAVNHLWYEGKRGLVRISAERVDSLPKEEGISWEGERQLLTAFEQLNRKVFLDSLSKIEDALRNQRLFFVQTRQITKRLLLSFHKIAGLGQSVSLSNNIPEAATFDELFQQFRNESLSLWDRWIRRSAEQTDHQEVNRILDYIRQYYGQNISLESMAKYVAMDKHYLSGLFKKKTGETLIQFLQKTRLEHAKYYLKQTSMTIPEVAVTVGFSSDNYFIKTFKKWYRITPSKYRESGSLQLR
jgi:two-component system response regulator YesN